MALPTRDEWLDYCQSDPLFFPTKVLGLDLWEKQVEIIRAIHEHERVAVQACHSASKTHTAAALTLSFLFSYFPSKVITTSAQKGQVRYALWNEIRSQIRNARLPLCPKECITVMSLNLAPDWFAIGLKPQEYNPEAFQGFHCLSEDHLIFTERGWTGPDEIQEGEKVLSLNEQGKVCWAPVLKVHRYEFDGFLNVFDGRIISFAVTDEHRFVAKGQGSGPWTILPYTLLPEYFRIRRVAEWGEGQSFEVPLPFKKLGFDQESFARFLGWWITDGGTRRHSTGRYYEVLFYQNENDLFWKIKSFLESFGLKVYRIKGGFAFSNRGIAEWLVEHCGRYSVERRIPRFLLDADLKVLRSLLESLIEGDGCFHRPGYAVFYTSSAHLVQNVQELSFKLGMLSSFRCSVPKGSWKSCGGIEFQASTDSYTVTLVLEPHRDCWVRKKHVRKERYKGLVWCITTPYQNFLTCREGGKAFWSGNSENVLIIFDEASGIPAPLWEAAEGLMTHAHCRFLAIGNPFDPLSTFGEVCNSPMWHRIKISAWDTPNVKAGRNIRPELMAWDWPEKMRKEWGEQDPRYYARVLGEFPETDSTLLIPPSKARAVLDRKPLRSDDYPVVIGLDPSGYGPDKNVWVVRQGLTILDIQWVAKATDEALAKRTKDLVDKWHASIVYVDGGWGKGVFDHLVRMGVRVRLVHLSQPSSRPDVQNLKTEAALKLRQAVDSGLALGPAAKREAQNWVADIAAPKLTIDPRTERQKLEDKRSLRSRLGRSPDFLDATLLTFVHADTSEWKPFELVVEREVQEGEHRPFGASQRSFSGRWQRPEFYFRRSLWLDRERGFA